MADGWIAGATRINGTKSGASYRTNTPWRHVWHTMEAPADRPPGDGPWGSISGLIAYIKSHQWPPHLWCWPERDWVGQTVNLHLAAYALVHDWVGYPETNHAHAIQVEILGYARDAPTIEHASWLGRRVLGPVLDEGIPIDAFKIAPTTGSDGAGTSGAVRLSSAQWYAFNGQCGHANVPRNEHWDPGRGDYFKIAQAATSQTGDGFLMALSDTEQKQVYNAVVGENSALKKVLDFTRWARPTLEEIRAAVGEATFLRMVAAVNEAARHNAEPGADQHELAGRLDDIEGALGP